MSETMTLAVLRENFLIEAIRESARRLCRIPDWATIPPKKLTAKLEEMAAEAVTIALKLDFGAPDTSQAFWRPQLNLSIIRGLRQNGADQIIERYANILDGSYPAIAVSREEIDTELKLVVVAAAETAWMVAYDLDPRLLYWRDEDIKFQKAVALALRFGVEMFFIVKSTNPDEESNPSDTV